MARTQTWVGAAVVALLAWLPAQAGVVVYSQPTAAGTQGIISDFQVPQQVADDFQLSGPLLTVTDLHWWGTYNDNAAAASDQFTVRWFSDVSGTGTVLATQAPANLSRVDTGLLDFSGLQIYRYDADLPAALTLAADTTYWLSIINGATSGFWGWCADTPSSGNGGVVVRDLDTDDWVVSTSGGRDVAFELTAGAVPEPATLTFLGLACLGAVLRPRRAA